ncbi:MAG: glycosyltransferase, partial [Pseudomonadota bacterium]
MTQDQITTDTMRLATALEAAKDASYRYLIATTSGNDLSWLEKFLTSEQTLDNSVDKWFNFECSSSGDLDRLTPRSGGAFGGTITWQQIRTLCPTANTNAAYLDIFPRQTTSVCTVFRRCITTQAVNRYFQEEKAKNGREYTPCYDELSIKHHIRNILDEERLLDRFLNENEITYKRFIYEELSQTPAQLLAEAFLSGRRSPKVLPSSARLNTPVDGPIATSFTARLRLDNVQWIDEIEESRSDLFEDADFTNDLPTFERRHAATNPSQQAEQPISVLIPVYKGYRSTLRCLESVLKSENKTSHRVVVLYDCGPDDRLEAILDDLSASGQIELHKNTENVGFVKTINRGFALPGDNDVVILNSDTRVPHNWLDRLAATAAADPTIATITPLTNNGEISSFPNLCRDNSLPTGVNHEQLDSFAERWGGDDAKDIPTGVGFCLYIRRTALEEVGPFDEEAFGRGYGEETDFCRRVLKAGWRNVLQTNLFVYHDGGVSFSEDKRTLVKAATKRVEQLHPGYARTISQYCRLDPLKSQRFLLSLHCLRASGKPVVLVVGHGEGGGTLRYINELRDYYRNDINFVWIEPHGKNGVCFKFPHREDSLGAIFNLCTGKEVLLDLLQASRIDHIHINHIRGIETFCDEVLQYLDKEYTITLHDYYFISTSPSLTDDIGRFDIERYSHSAIPPADKFSDIKKRMLDGAHTLTAPSEETAAIYKHFHPTLEIQVHEHIGTELIKSFPSVTAPLIDSEGPIRVVVIGALGKEKGADILRLAAKHAESKELKIEFHLIGYAYRELGNPVTTHGHYEEKDLQDLIRGISPHLIWFPCQWPETYSYTLTAAMDAKAPLLIPEIGAFVSRTRERPLTWYFPFNLSPAKQVERILECRKALETVDGQTSSWQHQPVRPTFYESKAYIPKKQQYTDVLPASLTPDNLAPFLANRPGPVQRILGLIIEPIVWQLRFNHHLSNIWFDILPEGVRAR